MSILKSTHPFDAIMKGPYRLVGLSTPESRESFNAERKSEGLTYTENTKCGGTCAHCGMAISIVCIIEGSEGRFTVGSTCVERITESPKLVNDVKRSVSKRRNDIKREKVRLESLAAKKWLYDNEEYLSQQPHPKGWEEKSLFNYLEWYYYNSGNQKFTKITKQYGFTK